MKTRGTSERCNLQVQITSRSVTFCQVHRPGRRNSCGVGVAPRDVTTVSLQFGANAALVRRF